MKTSQIILNALAMTSLALTGIASADETTKEGYLTGTNGNVVKNSFNECWKTGSWTPAMAIAECDPDQANKNKPKVAEVRTPAAASVPTETRTPAAALAPIVTPKRTTYVPLTLQADTLFDFDKTALHANDKKELDDEIVSKMKEDTQNGTVLVTGYADRIGTAAYNQKLSQRRADVVKDYLVSQGIASNRIETAAKGETEPVVSCDNVKGRVNGKNKKLVECLQPNRREMVEIKIQKLVQQ